jgi:hypothetical protein
MCEALHCRGVPDYGVQIVAHNGLMWIATLRYALGVRRGRARREATEALIVVAIRRPCGPILLACLCREAANLARRRSERTLMAVGRLARHGLNQEFEIVDHAVLRETRRALRSGRMRWLSIANIKDVQKYSMSRARSL